MNKFNIFLVVLVVAFFTILFTNVGPKSPQERVVYSATDAEIYNTGVADGLKECIEGIRATRKEGG